MKIFIGLLSFPMKICCSLMTELVTQSWMSNFMSLICICMQTQIILLALLTPCFTVFLSTTSEVVHAIEIDYFVNDQKTVIVPRLIYIKKIEVDIWELKYTIVMVS